MSDPVQRAIRFFTADIAAPGSVHPPRVDIIAAGLLTKLSIEYKKDILTYRSIIDPRIAYSVLVPRLRGGREERVAQARHAQIIRRLKMFINWGCINSVVWTFHSEPSISTTNKVVGLFNSLFDGEACGVGSVELRFNKDSGLYILETFRLAPDSSSVRLTFVLTGPLTQGSLPLTILSVLETKEAWQRALDISIEVDLISESARQPIEALRHNIAKVWLSGMYTEGLVQYQPN